LETAEQFYRLATYLQANQLLLDCLEVTTITNRAAIEAGLLLPPEGKGGEAG
jgi:hypothetical protein